MGGSSTKAKFLRFRIRSWLAVLAPRLPPAGMAPRRAAE